MFLGAYCAPQTRFMTKASTIRTLYDAGMSEAEIVAELGVTRQAVTSALNKLGRVGRPRTHEACQSCKRPYSVPPPKKTKAGDE